MTSLDRLALEVLLPGFREATPAVLRLLEDGLGGVCLFGSNLPSPDFTRAVQAVAPDAVLAVDEEGGDVTRLHMGTGSPFLGHAALGAVDDVTLTRHTAGVIGTALADAGVTLNLGPVADVNSNPDNPIIGVRSFGSDPALAARHVTAYVEGLQAAGVAACAKHFPGHGATHEDSHISLPRVDASLDLLRERELVPFAAAVEAGVAAVMTSHIVLPAIDPSLPATLSTPVLRVLRDELGFEGVIVSDALDMAGASSGRGIPAAAVAALRAGCDLLCLGADKDASLVVAVQSAIVEAVKAGELAESRLADAASRRTRVGPGERVEYDEARQLAGARAAIRVDGNLPDLSGFVLARIDSAPSIAVGEVPWGIPSGPPPLDASRLILQVRDAHRHPYVIALVESLEEVLVVDYGWPGPWDADVPRICTFGASRPSRHAVEELLRAQGWTS